MPSAGPDTSRSLIAPYSRAHEYGCLPSGECAARVYTLGMMLLLLLLLLLQREYYRLDMYYYKKCNYGFEKWIASERVLSRGRAREQAAARPVLRARRLAMCRVPSFCFRLLFFGFTRARAGYVRGGREGTLAEYNTSRFFARILHTRELYDATGAYLWRVLNIEFI